VEGAAAATEPTLVLGQEHGADTIGSKREGAESAWRVAPAPHGEATGGRTTALQLIVDSPKHTRKLAAIRDIPRKVHGFARIRA